MKPIYRIAVLCNNRMAVPALHALHSMGKLCAIGIPEHHADMLAVCSAFAAQTGLSAQIFRREQLARQLHEWIQKQQAEAVFMMTFPWKIPAEALSASTHFYNFHYGLLPGMRGADPVFEAIKQQCKETGITVHVVDQAIDRGPVILKQVLPLQADLTHGLLCAQLGYLGAHIIPDVLASLQQEGEQQDERAARYFKKPDAAEVCVHWETQDAAAIAALARACNPWNKGAYAQWNGWNIRVVEGTALPSSNPNKLPPGTVLSIDPANGLRIQCKDHTQLQITVAYTDEGFMSGHRLAAFGMKAGDRFTTIRI